MSFENLWKEKKNLVIFIILVAACLLFVVLSTPNSNQITCSSCKETISEDDFTYCPYCGESMSASQKEEEESVETVIPDSQKIIGIWRHTSSWASDRTYEYVFHRNGTCTASGYPSEISKEVSLYPYPYPIPDNEREICIGVGNGVWTFADNKLRIEYQGNDVGGDKGTVYHSYSFNEDGTELTIEGGKSAYNPSGIAVWKKVG